MISRKARARLAHVLWFLLAGDISGGAHALAADSPSPAPAQVAAADYHCTLDLGQPREIPPVGKNSWGGVNPRGDRFTVTSQCVELNGKPVIFAGGEMQPTRTDEAAWEESILKMKAGGLNTVSFYVLWNIIEQDPGQFDFTGNRNIRKFVELCAKHGMFVWLRCGPFCNGESIGGGLPQWLFGEPVAERSNDPGYLFYVARFYRELGKQLHGLMFKDGGPVVAIQLENEFQHASPYWDYPYPGAGTGNKGSGGASHMMTLKKLALEAGLDAPLYTCTSWGRNTPEMPGEFLATYGVYAYLGKGGPTAASMFYFEGLKKPDSQYQYPVAFCELGGGAPPQAGWRPNIPPESVEVALFTRVACGGNIASIYIYHGGINPIGKHGYMNIAPWNAIMSYDFQAPIGEFGRLKPAYYQTRPFMQFLRDFPDLLAPMVSVWPGQPVEASDAKDLRYMARVNGGSGFLFLNNFQDKLVLPDRNGVRVELKLKNETLAIPRSAAGLTLKSGVMAALPFNLPLGGARLKYATAQLMTKVDADGQRTFVFFAPKGMATEFAFEAASVRQIQGAASVRSGDIAQVAVTEPGTGAKFEVTPVNGKPFSILVLTRHQAEHCLRTSKLWGAERLVISENDLIGDDDALRVSAVGDEKLSFSVFPRPGGNLTGPGGGLAGSADGVFTHYSLALPKCEALAEVKKISDEKILVKVAPGAFEKVNDVFLRVDYAGDRGWAFIDGTLVADNYNHGVPWELGLKRWKASLGGKELFLRIVPWKGDTSKVLFDGITFKAVENATQPAVIRSAQILPEYAAEIVMQGQQAAR